MRIRLTMTSPLGRVGDELDVDDTVGADAVQWGRAVDITPPPAPPSKPKTGRGGHRSRTPEPDTGTDIPDPTNVPEQVSDPEPADTPVDATEDTE